METAAKYGIKDLFFEALAIEWRILRAIVLGTAAFFTDIICLFLGIDLGRDIQEESAAPKESRSQ
ncbi:MAG: hypothetical protein AAB734_02685 [Patescibacteria group bacterium]